MRIFYNITNRVVDSNGSSLSDFKCEVGDEMIAELNEDGVVLADGYSDYGNFQFRDPKPEEISEYVSLNRLFGLKIANGRYRIG